MIKVPPLGLFLMYDVDGDGNCFFSSCCKSSHIRMNNSSTLRAELVNFLKNNDEALVLFTDVVRERSMSFDEWVSKMQCNGTWGGATAAMFICLMFRVNICIISNAENGFLVNDIRSWDGIDFLSEDAPTIFLYHHLHRRPFERNKTCNHFAFMEKYKGANPEKYRIYVNEGKDHDDDHDDGFTSDTACDISDGGSRKKRKTTAQTGKNTRISLITEWVLTLNSEARDNLQALSSK